MTEIIFAIKIILSLVLGALVGLERELSIKMSNKKNFAGLRTFMLITVLGTFTAYISDTFSPAFLPVMLIGIVLLTIAGYLVTSYFNKDFGMTTEISVLLSFLMGVLVYFGPENIAIAFTISMAVFLSLRDKLHSFVGNIQHEELLDTLKFAIIAFVILPFLPRVSYDKFDVLNPYNIWLMVVFVSGIGFFGYVLTRIFGTKKGVGVTGLLGGLVSSTAVTTTMSNLSKKEKNTNPFVFATILASSVMFIRVFIEVYFVNREFSGFLFIPLSMMALTGIIGSLIIWHKKSNINAEVELKSPFTLMPALKFGLFYVLILFLSKISVLYLGNLGLFTTSIISGFADVDAITLSVSSSVGKSINYQTGIFAILLALLSNTVVKFFIAYSFGSKDFSKKIGILFLLLIVVGFVTTVFINR